MLLPWSHHHPATVNPTMFFNITVNSKPFGCVCLQTKFQRQQKTFTLWTLRRKDMVIKFLPYRIIQGFMYQGGDFTRHNGTGRQVCLLGEIWWWEFHPEAHRSWHLVHGKCWTRHKGSQFFISTAETEWLDSKHVVFHLVKDGTDTVTAMERYQSRNGRTSKKVTIADCGQLS